MWELNESKLNMFYNITGKCEHHSNADMHAAEAGRLWFNSVHCPVKNVQK